ncbi:MAG: DNA repair protein RadA [Mogibacterium sp.]|nr:DNA repair protein RadA [Mogibacterium sp.]
MAKTKKAKIVYMCTECGNEYTAWQGQCSYCGAWNTIVEQKVLPEEGPDAASDTRRRIGSESKPVKLGSVGTKDYSRMDSGIAELNRVLGGGIVPGSLVLISGEPGIGKSTIIAQAAGRIAEKYGTVLYVSGEESEEQVKMRADRVLGEIPDQLYIYPETNIENIMATCDALKPGFLIIDSIQTMYSAAADSVAGSLTQIRECSGQLIRFAKNNNVPVFIVAHVTKSGELAGPKTMEHMVDCVLSFSGERDRDLRIIRSFKNRFGTTDEIGAFRMTSEGMIEVPDLSGSLIETDSCEEGSVVSAVYEGSRPVFFEIQALVTKANVGFARRTAIGISQNRLSMILAVLEKKAGLALLDYDVYVNVVGGMSTGSTATDLAVALAIYSSFKGRAASRRVVAVGEVGLTGHLRSVPNADRIVQEAVRLGYEAVILPERNARHAAQSGRIDVSDSGLSVSVTPSAPDISNSIRVLGASNIRDAIQAYLSSC